MTRHVVSRGLSDFEPKIVKFQNPIFTIRFIHLILVMTSAFFSIRNDCFQRSHEHLRRYVVTTTATTTPGLNDVKRSGHDRQPDGHQQVEPYGHRAVAATTTAAAAATTTSSTAAEVTLACQG